MTFFCKADVDLLPNCDVVVGGVSCTITRIRTIKLPKRLIPARKRDQIIFFVFIIGITVSYPDWFCQGDVAESRIL